MTFPPVPPVRVMSSALTPAGTVKVVVPGAVKLAESAFAAGAAAARAAADASVAIEKRIAAKYGRSTPVSA